MDISVFRSWLLAQDEELSDKIDLDFLCSATIDPKVLERYLRQREGIASALFLIDKFHSGDPE